MRLKDSQKNKRTSSTHGLTLFAALCSSALFGALFGALCCLYIDSQLAETLKSAEESTLALRRSGSLPEILFYSLLTTGAYLLIAFVLGLCLVSQPFEFLIPFSKGVSGGVILTEIYGGEFSKLAALKAAAVFPGVFISIVVTVLAAREAVYMSNRLFAVCTQDKLVNGLQNRLKLYVTRFLGLLAITSVAAALDTVLAILLLGSA
ncbi:MAG: hypothetical protein LUE12_04395 [Ruminococcus sp.]|nr:hypothetical protein [Ruminococcus sp.]